jgi:hypothetical protein
MLHNLLYIMGGPMTLYVGLYQEILVGKIDRRNVCWVKPGF